MGIQNGLLSAIVGGRRTDTGDARQMLSPFAVADHGRPSSTRACMGSFKNIVLRLLEGEITVVKGAGGLHLTLGRVVCRNCLGCKELLPRRINGNRGRPFLNTHGSGKRKAALIKRTPRTRNLGRGTNFIWGMSNSRSSCPPDPRHTCRGLNGLR